MVKFKTIEKALHVSMFMLLAMLLFQLAMPIHEYGHYWAATGLGLEAYIEGDTTRIKRPPEADNWKIPIIRMAGGIFNIVVFAGLFILFRQPYRYALVPTIAVNAFYFPFDGEPLAQMIGPILFFVFLVEILPLYVREAIQRASGATYRYRK